MSLLVNEIFYSIQGESSFAGLPCVFVRLSGCNLRCRYCDTTYAYVDGDPTTIKDILNQVRTYKCDLVEITGGEPLLQAEVSQLTAAFLREGMQVLLETNGTQDINRSGEGVIRIMDIKCPSSGESQKTDWANIDRLLITDEVKFVIADRRDFDWACKVMSENKLSEKVKVLFAPVYGNLQPSQLVEWILQARLPVRFQPQLHKMIWGDKQGV